MWLTRARPLTLSRLPAPGRRYASLKPSPWSRNNRRPLRRPDSYKAANNQPESSKPGEKASATNSTPPSSPDPRIESLSSSLHDTAPQDNSLLAPVHIPEDPNAVLKERHPAAGLLANSGLVVQRQLEMMNVLM